MVFCCLGEMGIWKSGQLPLWVLGAEQGSHSWDMRWVWGLAGGGGGLAVLAQTSSCQALGAQGATAPLHCNSLRNEIKWLVGLLNRPRAYIRSSQKRLAHRVTKLAAKIGLLQALSCVCYFSPAAAKLGGVCCSWDGAVGSVVAVLPALCCV